MAANAATMRINEEPSCGALQKIWLVGVITFVSKFDLLIGF